MVTATATRTTTPPLLTEAEAARIFRVHVAHLGRLARAGKAPVTPCIVGERRMYSAAKVKAYINGEEAA